MTTDPHNQDRVGCLEAALRSLLQAAEPIGENMAKNPYLMRPAETGLYDACKAARSVLDGK